MMPPRVLASAGANISSTYARTTMMPVGETYRLLVTRVQKHVSKNSSAVDKVC